MWGAEARPEQSRRSLDCHLSTSGCCPCPGTPHQGRMEDLGKLGVSGAGSAARAGLGSHFWHLRGAFSFLYLRSGRGCCRGAAMEPCSLLCLPHPKGPMGPVVRRALGQKWSELENRKRAAAAPQAPLHPVGAGSHPRPGVGEPGSGKQPLCWERSPFPNVRDSQGREAKAERKSARPSLGEVVLWARRMGPG